MKQEIQQLKSDLDGPYYEIPDEDSTPPANPSSNATSILSSNVASLPSSQTIPKTEHSRHIKSSSSPIKSSKTPDLTSLLLSIQQDMSEIKSDLVKKDDIETIVSNQINDAFQDRSDRLNSDLFDRFAELEEDIEDNIGSHQNEVSQLRQRVTDLQNTTEVLNQQLRGINTNTTTSTSTTSELNFPILKILRKETLTSNYYNNIKDIKLESDNVRDLERFWNHLSTALMTVLASSNNLFPSYQDLVRHSTWDPKDILPTRHHPSYSDAFSAYKILSGILKRHLDTPTTIHPDNAPRAAIELELIGLSPDSHDGFFVLKTIIFKISPQLDGPIEDVIEKYLTLTIKPDMTLHAFFKDALKIFREFDLQADDTGAKMKLCEQFIKQLRLVPEFDSIMNPHHRYFVRHIKANGYVRNAHNSYYLQQIYDELTVGRPDEIKLHICSKRAQEVKILTTPTRLHQVIATTIAPSISAARITKNQFQTRQNQSSSSSNKSFKKHDRPSIDIRCKVCGKTNRDIIRNLTKLHTCTDANCIFRGPAFIPDQPMKETTQQYNLRNGDKPKSIIKDSSFEQNPPINAHLPSKVGQAVTFKDDTNNNEEDTKNDNDKNEETDIEELLHIPDESTFHDAHEHEDEVDKVPASSSDPNLFIPDDLYTPMITAMADLPDDTDPNNKFSLTNEEIPFLEHPSDLMSMRL